MKRILTVLASFALLFSLTVNPTPVAGAGGPSFAASSVTSHAQAEQTDPAKITVYVTRTGAKYHRENCRYLSKSKIPMSLKDASKRFEPCKVCKPPTVAK